MTGNVIHLPLPERERIKQNLARAPSLCAPCWEHGFCQHPDNCMAENDVFTRSVNWDSRARRNDGEETD